MADGVSSAYDDVAELYTSLFLRDLEDDVDSRPWVDAFCERAAAVGGPVLDAGCGPGHGVDFLVRRGLPAFGVDLSSGLIEQARAAFPEVDVRVGDMTTLEMSDASLGGLFARYSIIHVPPDDLPAVFAEWARVLRPGAPIVMMFFASRSPETHGTPFDHKVTTAYELAPAAVADLVAAAGFDHVETGATPPPPGGRPLDKGFVAARRIIG